jgi:hypothetical protein
MGTYKQFSDGDYKAQYSGGSKKDADREAKGWRGKGYKVRVRKSKKHGFFVWASLEKSKKKGRTKKEGFFGKLFSF